MQERGGKKKEGETQGRVIGGETYERQMKETEGKTQRGRDRGEETEG
jgi:hypothetical protein